jgi:GAF domain-containing protein
MMELVTIGEHRSERGAAASRDSGTSGGIEIVVAGLLRDAGVRRALQYLNARTRYRFTGIYRLEPPLLRNVCLFDRENPTLDCSGDVKRLDETYCSIVSRTSAPFATADARHDSRLREHPARETVLCYSGVPIRLPSGSTWGIFCHFDLRPRLMAHAEIPVLESVMPVIAQWVDAAEHGQALS